ncbi:unnamed protein product [Pylaiella littoralis]
MRREMIPPPLRFGVVEADVFRSAQPTLKNYRFLSRLKLRTVVSIAPEGPMEDEAMFCREHAAQLVPIRAELYREEAVTLSSQQVAQVLSILVNNDHLPALVHCPDGRVLSGVVLWCLRRFQCWDERASAEEFARFCGVVPSREVEKFVESYGEEVTVPPNVPRWLWGGDRAHWHPTIRIRHQPPLEVFEPDLVPSQKTLRGEIHTRTRPDHLRVRRGHIHAHSKLPESGGGGGIGTRGQGTVSAGARGNPGALSSSGRRRPGTGHNQSASSRQDSFGQATQDVSISMLTEEEEEGPKLSRAVQALSLEGLDGSSYQDGGGGGGGNDETVYEQQQVLRGPGGGNTSHSRSRSQSRTGGGGRGVGSARGSLS